MVTARVASRVASAAFGVGLSCAVLLDAFVLRSVLVPSLMHVFGNGNWYLPRWLDRVLPRVSVEGPPTQPMPAPSSITASLARR